MIIAANVMFDLAKACGAPLDSNAEGVARWAAERLRSRQEIEKDLAEARRELEESRRIWHEKKAELEKFADGVVAKLTAIDGLEKEWWVEVFKDGKWEFFDLGYLNATEARAAARAHTERWGHETRVVELLKRVLP